MLQVILEKTRNKAYGYALCPNTVSQNAVSTVGLHNRSSYLLDAFRYAEMATKCYNCDYGDFSKKYLNKYQKRSIDKSIAEKATVLLNDKDIQEAYGRLSTIPVVVLGNRIGGTAIDSSIDNEYGCERFNIRVVVVDEKSRECVRNLINQINLEVAQGMMYLTQEEICDFENKRNPDKNCYCFIQCGNKNIPRDYENSFVNDL